MPIIAPNIRIEKINPTKTRLLTPPFCMEIKELLSIVVRMSDCTAKTTAVEIKNGTTKHTNPKGVMKARLHRSFGNSQNTSKRKNKRSRMIPAISDRRTVSRIADTTLFSIC
jgi:hypothetical protein